MWYYNSVFYQIYTLGFCGAPQTNDGKTVSRILRVNDFIPHIKRLGANAVYFCPVFESDAHGYDTRDYKQIDCRLGTNSDFKLVCENLHQNGIRVVLDGVFNHVGRGHFAFKDVLQNRESSPYKDWFNIDFGGNNGYNDGLWYEGWEGHFELVRLNLKNPDVKKYLFECVGYWIDEFGIDGIRLDVAYMLDCDFMRELRSFCDSKKADFFLVGEMIHGDYNRLLGDNMLHSVTNYECYKGIYSSFNSMNMFEIGHSLKRQFGAEQWCLYRGKHLFSFIDNHDVSRISTILTNKNHVPLAFALLMSMPGIPCIYYGSEWGAEGSKSDGDAVLRAAFDKPISNALTEFISKCAAAHKLSAALCDGDFEILHMTNRQIVFERKCRSERVIVAINADECEYTAHFDARSGCGEDLISGENVDFGGGLNMPGYSAKYIKTETV